MVKVVAYYRVSTKSQGFEGLGMAAQREAVERYAVSIDAPIVATYEEIESSGRGDLSNRPQLDAAVAQRPALEGRSRLKNRRGETASQLGSGIITCCLSPYPSGSSTFAL